MSNKIDRNIKPLVNEMNKWKGVKPFASCQGHGRQTDQTYVAFTVDNYDNLKRIVVAVEAAFIQFFGWLPDDQNGEEIFRGYLECVSVREKKIEMSLMFWTHRPDLRLNAIRTFTKVLSSMRETPEKKQLVITSKSTDVHNKILFEAEKTLDEIAKKYNVDDDEVYKGITCLLQRHFNQG